MAEIKLYVTLEVPDDFFNDCAYKENTAYIAEGLQDLADGVLGHVVDLEIK